MPQSDEFSVRESCDISQLEPMLRQLFAEMDLGSAVPLVSTTTASPVLIQDLQATVEELSEICEVFAGRSLNASQLKSLAELEIVVGILQDKSAQFIAKF